MSETTAASGETRTPALADIAPFAAALAAAALFLSLFSSVLMPFAAGIALGYLLDPVAEKLQRVGFNRLGAALFILAQNYLQSLMGAASDAIAGAEVRWCQGFSEPGAGSDLASLQTRAVRDGDDYLINGQKIWTSNAHHADWILLLTRTDPQAPTHRGISMFVVDMKTPGITIRPLRHITGVHGFNEVFFEDVRVPATNMVGELNRGWYAATTTLDFERSGIERNLVARRDWERIAALLRTPAVQATLAGRPGVWRHQLAELFIAVEAGQWMARRVAYLQGKGLVPNYEASMSKTFNSELGQRVADFGVNVLGMPGQLLGGSHAPAAGVPAFRFLDARRLTIGQGTSEINRNIIATRGLGLPR